MIFIFLANVLVVAFIVIWLIQRWLPQWLDRYHSAFTNTAQNRLSEFFLFLDPAILWRTNLLICGGVFAVVVLVSGSPGLAVLASAIVLVAPRWALAFLRNR